MLKKRKMMALLLALAVALSFIWQAEPQIFAEDLDVTENEEVFQMDESALSEEIQEEEIQEEGIQEEIQEEIQEADVAEADVTASTEETAPTEENNVDMQSLYVITDPETHFTATYLFYDSDGRTLLNQQILSAGEKLQKPEVQDKEHCRFTGWYTSLNEGGEKFEQFGTEEPEMSESRTITLYAHYEEIYYVYYKAAADAESKVIYTQTYKDGETVSTSGIPFAAPKFMALVGWSQDPQAESAADSFVIQKDDIVLYPVLKTARWITFVSQGGTITDPQYVLDGNVTKCPEEPKRTGYQFGGWYTDPQYENAFEFGNPLEEDIELYARWIPAQISYTVVYWQQNPDDDGYSFKESKTMTGITGEMTKAAADRQYSGFSESKEKTIQQQKIRGDGSTVVHVYYDRNIYEIKFIENYGNRSDGTVISELTIRARYGADISNLWPGRRFPEKYGSMWKVSPKSDNYIYQSGIEIMPLNGAAFYKISPTGQKHRADYYVETLTAGQYILHHSDRLRNISDEYLQTTEEDYYGIQGFTVRMSGNPSSPKIGATAKKYSDFEKDTVGWKFYYTRNSYMIEFHNGKQAANTKTYKYEADISGADYTPDPPEDRRDYVFAGWYDNELGAGEKYVFEGKTMPANNLILYAKWVPAVYRVSFDLNGAVAEQQENPDAYVDQTVEKGQTVIRPGDPQREGYSFAGWLRDGEPFNFNSQITEDTILTAQWISEAKYSVIYDPNGGLKKDGSEAEAFMDSKKYAEGASAKILAADSEWVAPDKNKVFLGWSEQKEGEEKYHAGDRYQIPASDVTLYAVWGPARKTTLTYDYNGGQDSSEKESDTVFIEIPNAKYEIDRDGTELKKAGFYFTGWSTSRDGSDGVLLQKNDRIQIDTLEEEKNILYAQWAEETPIPTGVTENPIPFAAMAVMGTGVLILGLKPRRRRN